MGTRLAPDSPWSDDRGADEEEGGWCNFCEQYRILIRKQVDPNAKSPPDMGCVKAQTEYYLGDKNLAFDKFFHEKIASSDQGWLDVDLILTCAKMKAMSVSKRDLVQALTDSEHLEVNDDCSAIRRSGNKPLPALNRKKGKGGGGKGKDKGRSKGKDANHGGGKGKGYSGGIAKRLKRVGSYSRPWWTPGDDADPEGLIHAMRGVLHQMFEDGWEVCFGDGELDVEPHLFCFKTNPDKVGEDAMSLVMGTDFDGKSRDGEEIEHFRKETLDPFEIDLDGWFDEDEEDEMKACKALKSFLTQHGVEGFSYACFIRCEDSGMACSLGFGVITKSGFAIGVEACPCHFHAGGSS